MYEPPKTWRTLTWSIKASNEEVKGKQMEHTMATDTPHPLYLSIILDAA